MVLLKNDCEGAGKELAGRYEVRVYPTYALVDHAGEVTDRWMGYDGATEFGARLDAALADRSTIAVKKERFAAAPDLALAISLAQHAESTFASSEAVAYYQAAMTLDPALARQTRGKIFMAMFYGLRAADFTVAQLIEVGEEIMADPETPLTDALEVAMVVKQAGSRQDYVPFLERALALTAAPVDTLQTALVAGYRQQLAVDEALLIHADRRRALTLRREALPSDWREDSTQIHRFILWCLDNDLNLVEAQALGSETAGWVTDELARAGLLNTTAAIAFRRGDLAGALELQRQASLLAPDRERYQLTLTRYETEMATPVGEIVEPRTGTAYPDRLTVEYEGHSATLAATGIGLRARTFLRIEAYVIASYVSAGIDQASLGDEPDERADAIRALDAPKRIHIAMRRGASRGRLASHLTEVIERNDMDTSEFAEELETLVSFLDRDARAGDELIFDYLPGLGVVTIYNEEILGILPGAPLANAIWTVWFGERPSDKGLQRRLVGE